jgi:hypothetical protein
VHKRRLKRLGEVMHLHKAATLRAICTAGQSFRRNSHMAKVETASLERETSASGAGFRGRHFLVGQFFAILASVVGIYFASYVSFQRTLEYDRFTRAHQKSSLLTAAREEFKENIARLRRLNEQIEALKENNPGKPVEWPLMQLSIWEAAGHSPAFFDINPQILIEIQAFYADIGQSVKDPEVHEWYHLMDAGYSYDRKQLKQHLIALLELAGTSVVPALDNEIAEAQRLTKKYSASD